MLRKSAIVLILLLTACSNATATTPTASFTAPAPTVVEVTVTPEVTATSTASLSPVPEPAVTIPDMSQYDRAWFDEVGKTVKVTDLYGVGEATITVAEIKAPAEGQALTYKEMETLDQPGSSAKWRASKDVTLGNLTVERMSLLQIDIKDNSRMTDGDWAVFRMGTLIGGEKVSFDVFVPGGYNYLANEIFADWEVGDITNISKFSRTFTFEYFPGGGMTMDDWDEHLTELEMFLFLGEGSIATSRAELFEMIQQGGVLDKRAVRVMVIRP